jgi:hypothetical protein
MVVAAVVGWITAYFFGVSASLEAGKNLIVIWIIAGLLITILSPFFNLAKLIYYLFQRIAGFLRR